MTTYDQLTEWAGLDRVTRAGRDVVAAWRIPDSMKAQIVEVGIPVTPRLIERVVLQNGGDPVLLTSRGPLCLLTEEADPYEPAGRSSFGVEPVTGAVYFVAPDGEARFANSGVGLWLDVLHVTAAASPPQSFSARPDGPEEFLSEEEEEQAFAELDRLTEELKEIDPAAFDGYEDLLWPGLLDRWLY
ncbi:SUKH-4 family immunity protein [Streptomyces sp. NPDC090036]|uniref:SUKH-4 family immunity protein n=1 Tax=Streptomyces sp. NPDC090036 TaxID=3365926 RepID=UPI0037FE4ECE